MVRNLYFCYAHLWYRGRPKTSAAHSASGYLAEKENHRQLCTIVIACNMRDIICHSSSSIIDCPPPLL